MRINRKLNKSDIFELADDVTIFSKYLNISETDIIHCIDTGRLINSPLRADPDPSAGFKYNNKGRLKLRDFSGYFWGDCFDLVAFELGINVNTRHGFIEVLHHIYNTLTNNPHEKLSSRDINKNLLSRVQRAKRVIDIETREWNIHDRYYWNDFLYREQNPLAFVESQHVYPIKHYWMDRDSQPEIKYYYQGSNPAYAYYLGVDANSIVNYRLYFPFATKPYPKFISNNSSWQGLLNLHDEVDVLVITKSNKDRISILSFTRFNKLTIGVVAPPSENHIVSKNEYDWLASKVRLKHKSNGTPAIVSLYDFDRTGLNGSGDLKRKYGIPRVMFTDGTYNTIVTGNKDFTGSIPLHGTEKFHKIINNYINKLELI